MTTTVAPRTDLGRGADLIITCISLRISTFVATLLSIQNSNSTFLSEHTFCFVSQLEISDSSFYIIKFYSTNSKNSLLCLHFLLQNGNYEELNCLKIRHSMVAILPTPS